MAFFVYPMHEMRICLSARGGQNRISNDMKTYNLNRKNCLVIGGAGLLGLEIACQLQSQGANVRILDLVSPVTNGKFDISVGDIRHREDIREACRDIDVVFQTAAAVWDPKTAKRLYEEVNIGGNSKVIDTCIEQGVKRLVFTRTMDVVVDGKKPIKNGDESLGYPKKMPSDHYCRTKIIAEKMVLEANSSKLLTCALRPVGMYGPRDKYHIKNIIEAVNRGLKFKLGNGKAKFSHVYSENAAHAHILAAERLVDGGPVAGNNYFITDGCPSQNLFDFMEPFLLGLGLKPPAKRIPYPLAYILGFINEKLNPCSTFNRFSVVQTCVEHTFLSLKAERDLGYRPIVSTKEAFGKTLSWFAQEYGKKDDR